MRIENNSSDIQLDSLPRYSKLLSTSNAERGWGGVGVILPRKKNGRRRKKEKNIDNSPDDTKALFR